MFPWEACVLTRGLQRQSPEDSQDGARDLKFAKLTTNMAARGRLRKTLFPPSLASCLLHRFVFLSRTFILQAISNEKKNIFFKPLCWNVNENSDVDVAIDRAGYQSKKIAGKKVKPLLKFSSFFLLGQSHLRVFMVLASIRVELRALLSSEFLIREANISKTDPVTLLF